MKKYLEVGRIVSAHGLHGDVKVMSWCDTPEFICRFDKLYSDGGSVLYTVKKARVLGNMAIIRLEGFDTPEAAMALRQKVLYIDRESVKLPEDSYFVADLIGLEIVDETGNHIGTLKDVLKTGANDVYEISSDDDKLYYIPAVPTVVLNTDIEAGRMTIFPMEGLFD